MRLSKSQQAIYSLLKQRGEATIVEMRAALKQSKPDMRISEINRAYKAEHGTELIVTVRKKPNGEHVKGLATTLKKPSYSYYFDEERGVMVEQRTEVPV